MPVAIFFMVGVYLGLLFTPHVPWLLAVATTNWLLALCTIRKNASIMFILIGCMLQGVLSGALTTNPRTEQMLQSIVHHPRAFVRLEGRIVDDPIYTASERREGNTTAELRVRVQGVWWHDHWQAANANLRVYVSDAEPGAFEYGQRWIMPGVLRAPRHAASQAYHTLYTDFMHMRLVAETGNWSIPALCFRARRACAEVLERGLHANDTSAILTKALLLGSREELPDELRNIFAITGTFHIFAISGLHVGMMAILVIGVLKFFGVTQERWFWGLAPLLILYTIGTGGRASAFRACVMALIFWGAPVLRRRPCGLSALALAAILILLADATQLFNVGFIMSFTVVLGILLLYRPLASHWHRWISPDPYRLQAENPLVRILRRTVRYLGDLWCVSLAAWLASVPVTATYFNIFCPVSLLGNIGIVPGAFLAVFTGCLSLLTGLPGLQIAELFNFANHTFIRLLLLLVRGMAAIPYGHIYLAAPPWWLLAGWYAGVAGIFYGNRATKRLVLLFILAAIALACWKIQDKSPFNIDLLDVGQGHAAFVSGPGHQRNMLIDAGPEEYVHRVLRHLRKNGVNRLHALILSHPDRNFIGGAPFLMDALPLDELWCVDPENFSDAFKSKSDFLLYQQILEEARSRGTPIRYLSAGETIPLDNAQCDILWPETGRTYSTGSDGSIVLRIGRDRGAVLFMGGARQRVESQIMAARRNAAAPILVAGTHGMEGTCSQEWLNYVRPERALISVGRFNLLNAPHPETLQRLNESGAQIWRTDEHGALRIRFIPLRRGGHYQVEEIR